MQDREFPRSMLYCLMRAEDSLHAISGVPEGSFSNQAEKRCGQLYAELAYADVREIIGHGLHEYLDNFQMKLNRVGDAILDTYFALHPVMASLQRQ
jgi:uncharacterized alpha-E superfamily protein